MTWIVGTVPPFGSSYLISDICVSWQDGTEKHCLQKIHKVGRDFLCGFAGSVQIGFVMLKAIGLQFPKKQHLPPTAIATDWIPSLARRLFKCSHKAERKLGCQLIISMAHPSENMGDAPFPRIYIWTYTYPDFLPQLCGSDCAVGIGNGSIVPSYVEALRKARSNSFFLQLITHGESAQAQFLAREMRDSVVANPTGGVSPFFQYGILTRGSAGLGNYDFKRIDASGTTEVKVPNVADTYESFQAMCNNWKLKAAAAIC